MNIGGVQSVLSHDVHDALCITETADAYVLMPTTHAACRPQLTNFDMNRNLHWQHSIQSEVNYLNPFDAVISAWKLDWSILCDSFSDFLESSVSQPFENDPDGSYHRPLSTNLDFDDVSFVSERRNVNVLSQLHKSPTSCIRRHDCSKNQPKFVRFHDQISVHIGLEDDIIMHGTLMDTFDLAGWTEKPWSRRPPKNCQDPANDSHAQFRHVERRIRSQPMKLRTTDQYYDVPSTWFTQNEPQPDEHENPEDANFFLHEAPDSLQNLYDALFGEGVVVGPRIHDSIFLRTWFVHHLHAPQCFHFRVVEINGHWRHWFNDIISAWTDRIQQNEQVIFDIVQPNPPRTGVDQEILFDLILSQGIDAPRRAGLVSICQLNDPAQRVAYAVAVSLSETTSGHQIIQQAEYLHGCNWHVCSIRHGWERIPFTLEPVHEMQDGDSFIVVVRSADGTTATSAAAPVDQIMHAMPNPDNDEHIQDEQESQVPSPSLADSDEQIPRATIHRLGHVQTTGQVRRDTILHTLHDSARVVGENPDHFIAFHRLQCQPDDQIPSVDSLILQHFLDIPPGSTEKLVLIDVEMHSAQRGNSLPRAPPVQRQVHRILPTIVRQYLLQITRTDAYCEWHRTECLVYRNCVPWNQQARGPFQVQHGMYFRIVIPPPPDPTWDIGHAIRIFHEAADAFDFPMAGPIAEETLRQGQGNQNNQRAALGADQPPSSTLKGADLDGDIDVPMTSARRSLRAERPPRPTHDGDEGWFWELGHLFSRQAREEAFEGEFFVYVQTWYIDHQRHPTCRRPRPIRLDHYWITWLDEFCYAWRDVLDENNPYSVHVVRPRPPQYRHHGYVCHILIEQNRPQGRAAGILTALLAGHTNDGIIQGAFSVPRHLRKQDVIDTLEIEPFCANRRCTVYHDREPLHLVVATEVQSGFSIRSHIDPPNAQLPVLPSEPAGYFDDLMLMQLPPAQGQPAQAFQFNADAAEFQPGRMFADQCDQIHELFAIWSASVFTWENEAPSAPIITWFIDHRGNFPICLQSRRVLLTEQFQEWEELIRATWREHIDPHSTLELHVVEPAPPQLETGVVAHVILVQAPRAEWISSLVTIFDSFIGRQDNHFLRIAVTTSEHYHLDEVMRHCGYTPTMPVTYQGWVNGHQVNRDQRWPGRSGDEVTVRVNRQVIPLPVVHHEEETAMLQLNTAPKRTLKIHEILFQTLFVPVELIHVGTNQPLPACFPKHVLVPDDFEEHDIEQAIQEFHLAYHAYSLPNTGVAFVTPVDWKAAADDWHYVYYPLQFRDRSDVILHRAGKDLTEHDHMVLLHSLGFARAVIISVRCPRKQLLLVQYHNNEPALDVLEKKQKEPTAWPKPQQVRLHEPFFQLSPSISAGSDYNLSWDLTPTDLLEFFQSGDSTLCTWHSHLSVPEFVRTALTQATRFEGSHHSLQDFDRLIIYTDGSSKPSCRRKAPLWVQEHETPDAWAFIVLGETYGADSSSSQITFLGWHSQPVLYESHLPHFLGTDAIGSEFAEREGLFWSGIWRLGQNSKIPTVFRTDSSTTASQASGQMNCHDNHPTFVMLRSVFQTLSAGIGEENLIIEHVAGHAGDVWNELADFLAKTEAAHGHKLQRQQVDLQKWKPYLPFLWMIVDQTAGVPQLTHRGFDISPPNLPSAHGSSVCDVPHRARRSAQLSLSLATANIGSLFIGPEGYAGKLQYLREQMHSFKFNIIGLQETRSPSGMSTADDILRLAGGAHRGQFGVEIWISLTQPIGFVGTKPIFLKKSHAQIVHADPRRLLARLDHPAFQCFILTAHAPQSGRPREERQHWWSETNEILHKHCKAIPLVVLIDANAKSGPQKDPIVFAKDDTISANTEFLIDFLQSQNLCLPSTGQIHTGPDATWTSLDGHTRHRIDYVAVPQQWIASCTYSSIISEFDLGNAHDDHQLVGLQLCWKSDIEYASKHTTKVTYCREAIGSNRDRITCENLKALPWNTDVETQVQSLNTQLMQEVCKACPISSTLPKKRCLQGEVWEIRAKKFALQRRLRHASTRRCQIQLRFFFHLWKVSDPAEDMVDQHIAYVQTNLCITVRLQCQYVSYARKLRSLLRKAKTIALDQEISALPENAPAGTILHCLKPFLGPTNPKKIKRACLPFVKDAEGNVCATPAAAQQRWIEYFQHMEGGQRLTHDAFREIWLSNLNNFLSIDSIQVPIHEMPTLVELETAFRRVAVGKAIGNDGIPPELCRFKARDLARLTYSLLLKTCLFGQEALEHKGGRLAIAWKHKGDPAECSSHRSLLVSSHIGKTIHRALRQRHHALYTQFMQTQQLGGRPNMPVGVPLHMTRAFMRWKFIQKRPVSVIFLDLTEAFYRVVRVLAVGGNFNDEHIAYIAKHLGYSSETMHEFYQQLQEPSAIAQTGAPEHVQHFMQALHTDTWFTIGDQCDLVRTEQGSRPGDSFADVVFGLLWAQLLRTYEAKLVAADVLIQIPDIEHPALFGSESQEAPHVPFIGPTWMDDLSVCLCADSNTALLAKTGIALSILIDLCHDAHMQPNLKKGKTEVLFHFQGPGARAMRRKFYSETRDFPVVCERATHRVSVVSRYLHLGGILHHKTVTCAEITRRLGIAQQAFTQHRRILYRNAHIDWKKRREMFSTLVLSKLVYGFESWTFDTLQSRAQLHTGIIKLYKRLLGSNHAEHLTDEEVIIKAGLPSPTELLRGCRLRYFGTLYKCGRAAHWGLLCEDAAWIAMLEDDIQWLWTQLQNNTSLPDPKSHFPAWNDILLHHGGYWKKLIKKGLAHACLQRENEATAVQLHRRVAELLHKQGWITHLPTTENLCAEQPEVFGCMHCQTSHASKAGESAHMFKKHGFCASARQLFADTSCPNCLREYHTRAKVLAHLRHVHHCRQSLLGRRLQCHPTPGTGSCIDRALHESIDGAIPFLQGEGPKPPDGALVDFIDYDVELLEALYIRLTGIDNGDHIQTAMCEEIRRKPISWTMCKQTLCQFIDSFSEADAEPLQVSFDQVVSCMRGLILADAWPFLFKQPWKPDSLSKVRLDEWENWYADLAVQPPGAWDHVRVIPRIPCRYKIVLHAYAGRRRRGDIEWYMSALAQKHPDFIIMTASVDIIIDAQYGDIAKTETREFWLAHIMSGHVVAFIGGPPCNTWSKARNIQLADSHGPRVVRSPEAPWGLLSLRLGEIRQVMIGTLLLGFAFECLAALATQSGVGILEHPKDPERPDYVSIWRLAILRMLLTLPNMRLVSMSQGLYGAPSPKPTTFLVLGLPTLEAELHRHMLTGQLPCGTSIGKDANGQYRTAPLKEYPPALCQAVAQSMCTVLACTECGDFDSAVDPPLEFIRKCAEMRDDSFDGCIGHDG